MITTPLTPEIKKGPIRLLEGSLKQNVGKEVGDRLTELKCIVRRFFSWDFKVFCKIISVRPISGSAFAGSLSSQTTDVRFISESGLICVLRYAIGWFDLGRNPLFKLDQLTKL